MVPQYLQHALGRLLFGVKPVDKFTVFIVTNNNVFGRRYQAVLNTAIAAYLILVSACMKKADIQWLFIICRGMRAVMTVNGIINHQFWKKHFINMFL